MMTAEPAAVNRRIKHMAPARAATSCTPTSIVKPEDETVLKYRFSAFIRAPQTCRQAARQGTTPC